MGKAAGRRRTAASAIAGSPRTEDGRWPWIYCFGIAFAIALAVFGPALDGNFVFDDLHLPFAHPDAARMPAGFWIGGVRPVLMATYWINFLISGTRPFTYHLVNLLLHAGTSAIVFFIYDRLLVISHALPAAGDRRWLALFGAALFLVHPLQTESVDYIAGRSELVSGFFFFAAWLVFLRNFEKHSGLGLTVKILVLAALGVLGKESAISLPALLLMTDLYFADRPMGRRLAHRLKLYSVFATAAAAGALLILRSLRPETSAGFQAGPGPFNYSLTQCRVILTYVRLFMVPAGQNADWKLPFYHSFREGGAWLYVIGLIILAAFAAWLYKRERLISFGLASFLLMLAPTSSIVPISDALAERRMYLPISGLILAFIGAAANIPLSRRWRGTAATAIILTCSVLSWNRSAVWADDFNLWSASKRANPANYRARLGLGVAMLRRGDCSDAAHEFATALLLQQSDHEEVL